MPTPTIDDIRSKRERLRGLQQKLDRLTGNGPSKQAEYSRRKTSAGANVAPLPAVVDQARKDACRNNLFKFLTTYFPATTGLSPFSADHRRVIKRIQRSIVAGGRFCNAVYRGFAKTTISENAALWATLYGHRRFVLIVGINQAASQRNVEAIRTELTDNELLLADFPEVCHPFQALEGRPQRCPSQHCDGALTHILCRADVLVLPSIAESKASGAIILARPYAKARGVKHKRADGANARPDLVIVDDPQDEESAASPVQVAKNLDILKRGILRSAGHHQQLACVVNATVIARDDMIERLLAEPSWHAERVKLVRRFADAHETLWLGEYKRIRQDFDRGNVADLERARKASTAFYRHHRAVMDAGCEVSWVHCHSEGELSAVQHAYNVLIDDGAEVFASECQNEPVDREAARAILTREGLSTKLSGIERMGIPKEHHCLVAFCDVHDRVLYYAIACLQDGMGGMVVDYGCWPEQPYRYFAEATSPVCLGDVHPGNQDAYLWAGLQRVTDTLFSRIYLRDDGTPLALGKFLVDAHWGEKTELVKRFCRRSSHYGVLLPSFGVGVKPGDRLRAGLKPGGRNGPGWCIPPAEGGEQHVIFDADWQKSQLAVRLAAPKGTAGGWEIFGSDPKQHDMLFDHLCAERPIETTRGEHAKAHWELRLGYDNHYWDCLVGCHVAGLVAGVKLPEFDLPGPAAASTWFAKQRRRRT